MANQFKAAAERKRLEAERKRKEEEEKAAAAAQLEEPAPEAQEDEETPKEKEKPVEAPQKAEETVQPVEPVVEPVEETPEPEPSEPEAASEPAPEPLAVTDKIEALLGPAKKTKKPAKGTVALYLSKDNQAWLKKTAASRGMSVSEFLDQILTELRG